jgi:solute carrier family 13 (sodium-dependent dicarboxylate transporter), member 2/3/5
MTRVAPPSPHAPAESPPAAGPAVPVHRLAGLLVGPLLFAAMLALPAPSGMSPEAQRVAALALLMACWWMTEALPLAATALLPIPLLPALGVMTTGAATAPFADPIVFLFMGGFFIALAMQRWGLHRRIALAVVAAVGTQPGRLVLGFMAATAFLSAWISNTATAVMMLPIGVAVLTVVEGDEGPLGTALMLGIAYGATIGGVATLIGTPPNAVFAAAAGELLDRPIGFLEWMYVGVPLATVMLVLAWQLIIRRYGLPLGGGSGAADELLRRERAGLGAMGRGERVTAIVFTLTALGWVFREPKDLGGFTLPGLATALPMLSDSAIAIAGALALFAIPASLERGEFVLDWAWARRIPWEVLLLFGGGLALAAAFVQSGLSVWIGERLALLGTVPALVLVAIVAAVFCFLTELTSNTATAAMGMPLMVGVAAGTGGDPLVLMAVAALSTSMAFMLPVATPPNAIVFGSGRIRIAQMIRTGWWLNLLAIALVTLVGYWLVGRVFG